MVKRSVKWTVKGEDQDTGIDGIMKVLIKRI